MDTPVTSDRCVGVVGVGTLGTTVVQLALDHGDHVVAVHRPGQGRAERVRAAIERSVAREVERGRMDSDTATAALDRLVLTAEQGALVDCGIVVETTPEDLAGKREVIASIEAAVAADTIIASGTSSLPASSLALHAQRPERIVVAHYIWPANRMRVVEVAVPDRVSPDTIARLDVFFSRHHKTQLRVSDTLGFYVTRVLYIYWSRMVGLLAAGMGPDEIDAAMEAAGWRMGPCRLLDGTGLGSVLQIFDVVRPSLGGRADGMDRLRPLVEAGHVGGSTRRGCYDHTGSRLVPNHAALALLVPSSETAPSDTVAHLEAAFVDETQRCLDEGVIESWEQAALGVDGAYGFPGGLLRASGAGRVG